MTVPVTAASLQMLFNCCSAGLCAYGQYFLLELILIPDINSIFCVIFISLSNFCWKFCILSVISAAS